MDHALRSSFSLWKFFDVRYCGKKAHNLCAREINFKVDATPRLFCGVTCGRLQPEGSLFQRFSFNGFGKYCQSALEWYGLSLRINNASSYAYVNLVNSANAIDKRLPASLIPIFVLL